jgi:hypothetical protein
MHAMLMLLCYGEFIPFEYFNERGFNVVLYLTFSLSGLVMEEEN